MSLVNELLDDLQQQQRSQNGPIDIPALENLPRKDSAGIRWLIWGCCLFLSLVLLVYLSVSLSVPVPSGQTPWGKPPAVKAVDITLVPIGQGIKQTQSNNLVSSNNTTTLKPKIMTLNSQFYVQDNSLVIWLQSPQLLDMGILQLADNRQQLLIKQAVDFAVDDALLKRITWVQIAYKRQAQQTWLNVSAESPIKLTLEPVKEKLGWFNYQLTVQLEHKKQQTREQKKAQKQELAQANTPLTNQDKPVPQVLANVASKAAGGNTNSLGVEQALSDEQLLIKAKKLEGQGLDQKLKRLLIAQLQAFKPTVLQSDLHQSRLWFLQYLLLREDWKSFDQILNEGELRQGSEKALVKLAARAKLKRKDYKAAWQLLNQLPLRPKADAEHVQLFANLAYRMQRFAKAKELYQSLVSHYPEQPNYAVGLARSLEALEQPQQALSIYEFAFKQGIQQDTIKKFVVQRIIELKQVENQKNL